jgi:hypothetical protein
LGRGEGKEVSSYTVENSMQPKDYGGLGIANLCVKNIKSPNSFGKEWQSLLRNKYLGSKAPKWNPNLEIHTDRAHENKD